MERSTYSKSYVYTNRGENQPPSQPPGSVAPGTSWTPLQRAPRHFRTSWTPLLASGSKTDKTVAKRTRESPKRPKTHHTPDDGIQDV
eukprot:1818197-Pyramimonas_sp.AAC.1